MFISDPKNIMRKTSSGSNTHVWFVNSSANIYEASTNCHAVTTVRIEKLRNIETNKKMCSIEEFRYRHMGLHMVARMTCPDGASKRLECDCAYFWNCNTYCSHVVAVYHVMKVINIYDMMSSLKPARKRGRPTITEKALERDKDLLATHMANKPFSMKKCGLWHPEYTLGFVYGTYTGPGGKQVWEVRFTNAPGGEQDFEVLQPELEKMVLAFEEQKNKGSKVRDPRRKKA